MIRLADAFRTHLPILPGAESKTEGPSGQNEDFARGDSYGLGKSTAWREVYKEPEPMRAPMDPISVASVQGAPPGTAAEGDLRWLLPEDSETVEAHLKSLVRKAYVALREPELVQAVNDLLHNSRNESFRWMGPTVSRNLTLGDHTKLELEVQGERRSDGRLELKASAHPKLQATISRELRKHSIGAKRSFEVFLGDGRPVDDVFETLHRHWPRGLTGEASAADWAPFRKRAVRRAQVQAHRDAILALFDDLWPRDRKPKVRARARESLERSLRSNGQPNCQEFLRAIFVPGSRATVRDMGRQLAEEARSDETKRIPETTIETSIDPCLEVSTQARLKGDLELDIHWNEPIRSGFSVYELHAKVEPTGEAPVSDTSISSACMLLEHQVKNPKIGPQTESPAFRVETKAFESDDGEDPHLERQTRAFDREKVRLGIRNADGSAGPKSAFEFDGVVFYGTDALEPARVFESGIPPKRYADVFDVAAHQNDDPRSGLRGSCISAETPAGFAGEDGWVYALAPVGGAVDLQVLDYSKDSKQATGASGETEFAFGSMQPAHVIVGAFPVGPPILPDSPQHRLGAFLPNPNLAPELKGRLPAHLSKHFDGSGIAIGARGFEPPAS